MRLTSLLRSTAVSTKLAKPQMRGLLIAEIKRTIAEGFAIGTVVAAVWYFWAMKPRKENYANFYKNYDPDKGWTSRRNSDCFPYGHPSIVSNVVLHSVSATKDGL